MAKYKLGFDYDETKWKFNLSCGTCFLLNVYKGHYVCMGSNSECPREVVDSDCAMDVFNRRPDWCPIIKVES